MSTNKNDYYHLGLTDDEVLQSREKNGINLLTPPKRPSLWKLYLEKFEDPVVRVLLVASPTCSTRMVPCPSTTVVPRITRLEA